MTFADEQWRPVVDWPWYDVSDHGRVRSWFRPKHAERRETPKVLRPGLSAGRYYWSVLLNRGRLHARRSCHVHVLVLEAFVCPRPAGMVACHNNGDGLDNRVENLRWDTVSANVLDQVRHGTKPRSYSKLSERQVAEILAVDSSVPARALADAYGVNVRRIYNVRNGKTWPHVFASPDEYLSREAV